MTTEEHATPLDEMLANLISDLHARRYDETDGGPNPRASLHAIALVLADTRTMLRGRNGALTTGQINNSERIEDLQSRVREISDTLDRNSRFTVSMSGVVDRTMSRVDDIAKRVPLFTAMTSGSGGGGAPTIGGVAQGGGGSGAGVVTLRSDGWKNLVVDPTTRSLQDHIDELSSARAELTESRRTVEQLTGMLKNEREAYDKALAEARAGRAELQTRIDLYETTLAETLGTEPKSTSMAAMLAQVGVFRDALGDEQREHASHVSNLEHATNQEIGRIENERDTANKAHDQIAAEYNTIQRNFRSLQKLLQTTQEQLDKFTSACADQTLQIMELRGAALWAQEQHQTELSRVGQRNLARVAAVMGIDKDPKISWQVVIDTITDRAADAEKFKRDAANATGHPDSYAEDCVIEQIALTARCYAELKVKLAEVSSKHNLALQEAQEQRERAESLARQLNQQTKRMLDAQDVIAGRDAEIDSLTGQLSVADADRIPLRMDLDEARGKLTRLEPMTKAMHIWRTHIDLANLDKVKQPQTNRLAVAFDEWQDAEAKAQNPSADDDIAF